jgi:glycosyltransferase involved in cell wall biosynthesis
MEENRGLLQSIIVPVYNMKKYIRPCMESIFRQKYSTLMI